ncbi:MULTISPECIES: hypothetical protein [Streptomyces]|uniref:hypothetical protein n=1 Tax=Streptomyces TaxID=1883 RepID=UPI001E62B01E|nr:MULTISPECIES: hypothetical protein [Streptomyces]UFQ17097.1 hypothetical protein J2N69_19970 [Streptomyces huasconensis]WCL86697.1 hypothetical protein PPN52_19975 [Streptomyces sp. JCM 35825]
MAIQTLTLSVLIASPGDTASDRDVVEDAIRSWNSDHTMRRKIHLLPLRWELGAVPLVGQGDAQEVINAQFADEADIVIAVFNSRLGQATQRAVSGTAEEILRARDRGAAVHVFFSEAPIPRDHDPEQLAALNSFRKEVQEHGLTGNYASADDLKAKVRTCLEHDAYKVGNIGGDEMDRSRPGAVLRSSYTWENEPKQDSRGRIKMRRTRQRLLVENLGEVAAENVELEMSPVGEGTNPTALGELTAPRIPPKSSVNFPILLHSGVARQGTIVHRWTESDTSFSEEQTISWT